METFLLFNFHYLKKVANGQFDKLTPQCKLETISVAFIKCKAIDTFTDVHTHLQTWFNQERCIHET